MTFCVFVCEQKLTAYLDLTLRTCFVIPLNTSVVLPPQDLIDLFSQLMVSSEQLFLCPCDVRIQLPVEETLLDDRGNTTLTCHSCSRSRISREYNLGKSRDL